MRSGLVLASALATGALLLPLCMGTHNAEAEASGLSVGAVAPAFTLKSINGTLSGKESITLADHVGAKAKAPKRVVFVTFGASYCAPCRTEWTRLAPRYAELAQAGVEVLAVVIDRDEKGQLEMTRFVQDTLQAPFPVLLDRFGILARRYHASSLPYSVLIDGKSGTVSEIHVGYEARVLDALIGKLTAAPSTPP